MRLSQKVATKFAGFKKKQYLCTRKQEILFAFIGNIAEWSSW